MKKGKIIYILSLILITVLVSTVYFSYAFFTSKNEEHGKLNIVVGTMKYKLTSSELSNNEITVPSKSIKMFDITITSLNTIDSKYELYYISSNDDLEVGYMDTTTDLPIGIIQAKSNKTVTVKIRNRSDLNVTLTFGVEGGLKNNNLVLSNGKSLIAMNQCTYDSGYVWNYDYIGDVQEFVTECDGIYKLETWGAKGGDTISTYIGGYGSYSTGVTSLFENDKLYVYVGGAGTSSSTTSEEVKGGYNGGGKGKVHSNNCTHYAASGGGATHIATSVGLLSELENDDSSILIVSAGGGGAYYYYIKATDYEYSSGASAGGYIGNSVTNYVSNYSSVIPSGGTQLLGGSGGNGAIEAGIGNAYAGTFGLGGNYLQYGSGGGGGYYGGGGGNHIAGGGGSGYIGSSLLTDKAMYCYNCTESTDTDIYTISTTGSSSLRDVINCPNGYSSNPVSKCAMASNGYAKITYIGDLIN